MLTERAIQDILMVVVPGKIADFGTNERRIASLASKMPTSEFVGVSGKILSNSFDSALLIDCVSHVAPLGKEAVASLLDQAFHSLKSKGRVIICDGIKPECKQVSVTVRTEQARRRFEEFTQRFTRKVVYSEQDRMLQLDQVDLMEFLVKTRKRKWEEKLEPSMLHSLEDFDHLLGAAGFVKVSVAPRCPSKRIIPHGITYDEEFPHTYGMLVYEKP